MSKWFQSGFSETPTSCFHRS